MNDDRTFERNARAWLELGPTDLPDRVVVNTLRSIESTPQERDLRFPWKGLRMSTPMRLAAAAAFAALALAGGLVLRNQVPSIGAPSQTPSTGAPSQTPVATLVQAEGPPWLVFLSSGAPTGPVIDESSPLQLWAVKTDGSGLHILANGKQAQDFDISPDGMTIVFTADGDKIWEAPIAGGAPTLLSTDCAGDTCADLGPSYSPDGATVAFARIRTNVGAVIVLRDQATGAIRELESTRSGGADGLFMRPSWSPDGTRLAIAWPPPGVLKRQSHIAVVPIDGTPFVEFPWPSGATDAGRPDWSPDGSRILFATFPVIDSWAGDELGTGPWIYTIRPDGTDLHAVCPDCPVDVRFASWSPDGTRILIWDQRSWALMDPDVGTRTFLNEQALTFPGAQFGLGSPALLQPTR